MSQSLAHDLEFDRIIELVATHARTGTGRFLLRQFDDLPPLSDAREQAALTIEMERLLVDDGPLSLSGVDEAISLLQPGVSPAVEPAELVKLLVFARRIAAVRRRLFGVDDSFTRLKLLATSLPDTSKLVQRVAPLLGRDGRVPDDATPELARLRHKSGRVRQQLLGELEALRRGHADVVTDAPPTVRRDRYCLPVKASLRSQLSGLVLDTSGSGATVYFEPFGVVELNNSLATVAAGEREEIRRIVAEISGAFAAARDDLVAAAEILGRFDAAQARSMFGTRVEGRVVMPGEGEELVLMGARHPLLDQCLGRLRLEVFGDDELRDPASAAVPLDFHLVDGVRTLVISGPNAGGKTVALKTIGLMVLMAYHGIPLPADDGTVIPVFDQIWCHIGDEQDVARDLSTFSGAMAATAVLLRSVAEDSLVLYDELGAGTDPLEGAALGCALLEELNRRSCMTVVTTHLAGIAMAATSVEGMENAAMDYDEEREMPTFGLRVGRPGRSHGLEIAGAMGVQSSVLERARELLGGQHLELDRWLERLGRLEAELLEERAGLEREERETRRLQVGLIAETRRLDAERAKVTSSLVEERDRLRKRAKNQLDQVLGELEEATKHRQLVGKRRQQQMRRKAMELPEPSAGATRKAPPEIIPGTVVRVAGLGATGVVQEVRGSRVQVAVGNNRLWVETNELETAGDEGGHRQESFVRLAIDDDVPGELMLLGMDREDARDAVERYLDRAFAVGKAVVRVVHGHGTGALHREVEDICRDHPAVRSFRHPPRSRGGEGATEITLEGGLS